MKAYKGFKPDLTWDGFQFEIGKHMKWRESQSITRMASLRVVI